MIVLNKLTIGLSKMPNFCIEEGCNTRSSQGYDGGKPQYCAKHKKEGMVNVVSARCKECSKRPHFNYDGEKKGIYCVTHKKKNMIIVTMKKCKQKGCSSQPCFNYEDETQGLYCSKHKLEGMVDVKNPKCAFEGCHKNPSYGKEGEKRKYCSEHKEKGMVDAINNYCKIEGCYILATFNYKGKKCGKYCNAHKKENMINIKNSRCEKCDTLATFGTGKTATRCKAHKTAKMKDVRHVSCLECDKRPNFNTKGEKKGIYCRDHKKENMVDVTHKRCKSEWCDTHITNKYDGYCHHCFVHLFPDHELSRSYNTKEKAVAKYIVDEFPGVDVELDKRIDGGCSKRRPDIYIDIGSHVIIIEVDENQHLSYDQSCESKRIMEIWKDIGYRSLVVVRFNPDKYVGKTGETHPTCWKTTQKGTFIIKTQKEKWEKRLKTLSTWIEHFISEEPEKSVTYKYICYDR